MKKHVNIPVFIPHLGCPNQCVFCNQRAISGVKDFIPGSVRDIIDNALSTVRDGQTAEIAFFGGSFTGIERSLMIELLKIANEYIASKRVKSIRCSTRPDYIDEEILSILKEYNVSTIELGLQSSNDSVLRLAKRGHDFSCEEKACKMIKEQGFSLVGQMMIGLPGSTFEKELETAEFIINSGAESARIYPTVVFKDTELYQMSKDGLYTPISLEDAVRRSAAVMERFLLSGVEVIRIGLCSSENLVSDNTYYAGPNHSALGELVIGEVYYNLIKTEINSKCSNEHKRINIYVPKNSISKAKGQHRYNETRLANDFPNVELNFCEDEKLKEYQILVESKEEIKCI